MRATLYARLALLALCMFAAGTVASDESNLNLLENSGFEEVVPYEVPAEWKAQGMEATELPKHCAINPAYPGKLTMVYDPEGSHGGMKYIHVERKQGEVGVMHGSVEGRTQTKPGEKFVFSVWARGKGKLSLYAYLYDEHNTGQVRDKSCVQTSWELSDEKEWRLFRWELVMPEASQQDSRYIVGCITAAYHVEGVADLDDGSLLRVASGVPIESARTDAPSDEVLRPLLTITKTEAPPVIDGEIGVEEWRQASAATGFVDLGGTLTEDDTLFYVTYDDANLYLAFKSTVPGKPKAEVRERDKQVHEDDAVEIFLQPRPEQADNYYQFVGNSIGAVLDGWRTNATWNADWRFANKVVDSGETVGGIITFARSIWTGEVAVAFKDLGVATPKNGETWRLNFCRDWTAERRGTMGRWTSWSPTGGNFHKPENFGYLRFREKAPAIQVVALGDLTGGDIHILGNIHCKGEEASLAGELRLVLPETGKEMMRKEFPLKVAPSRPHSLEMKETVGLVKPLPLRLLFGVRDAKSAEVLSRTALMFTARPSFRMETALLYSRKELEVSLDARRLASLPPSVGAVVEIQGKEDGKPRAAMPVKELTAKNPVAKQAMSISEIPPGDYVARAYLKDGDRVIAQSGNDLTLPEKPQWWGNQLGVSDKPPPPWTPVRLRIAECGLGNVNPSRAKSETRNLKSAVVSCWGREYRFDNGPLPSKVIAKGKPLLASPMGFHVVTAEGPVKWRKQRLDLVSHTDTKAKFRTVAESNLLKLEGSVEVEFDGFVRVDLTLTPKGAIDLKRLYLEVPVKEENALYMKGLGSGWHAAALYPGAEGGPFNITKQWFFSTDGWVWPDKFMNYIWIGGDEAGLSVSFDSDRNFRTQRYVEIVAANRAKQVVYNFIDSPYSLGEPLTYTFALQATPVKPLPQDAKRWHYGYQCGDEIALYQDLEAACSYGLTKGAGWPELTPAAKEKLAKFKEAGLRAFPDFYTNLSTVEMPEFQLFGKEWETLPSTRWPWSKPHTSVVVCARKSYADFLLYGLNKLMDEGVGGIYFDSGGTCSCTNTLHGCGYVDEEGKVKPTIGLFEARETYKRIYTLLKSRDPNAFIFHHAVPISPLASFVDGATESEEWSPGNVTIDDLKPDFVRFGFAMYHQYGIPYSFYPSLAVYGAPEQQIPFKQLLPVTLIHNVYPITWCGTIQDLKPIWKIMDDWRTTSEWIPYWKNSDLVRSFHKDVKVSVYLKRPVKQSLLLVANVGKEPQSGTLSLNLPKLGLSERKAKVTRLPESASFADASGDASGEAHLSGSELSVTLPGRSIQFYRAEPR